MTTTVPPESICTSAAGLTRWTQGQCTHFALASTSRGTNEARDETETKPRESRVLQWPHLRALYCLCLLFVYVSLLVIRSHLPKRFSRKPQPPLVISSMHHSRLELLSLEIKAYVNTKDFEVKLRLFIYRSVNLLSKYPCRTRNFSNNLIENGKWSVVSVVTLRLISFALQLHSDLSVSFRNGKKTAGFCSLKARFLVLWLFTSLATESVLNKFGFICLEKGEIFWMRT